MVRKEGGHRQNQDDDTPGYLEKFNAKRHNICKGSATVDMRMVHLRKGSDEILFKKKDYRANAFAAASDFKVRMEAYNSYICIGNERSFYMWFLQCLQIDGVVFCLTCVIMSPKYHPP